MSGIELRDTPLQHTAVVRVTTSTATIGDAMGRAFETVYATLARLGVPPAGPALSKYTRFSAESVSFEAGVPVTAPFRGEGDVMPGEVGGCRAAVMTHHGPYDTIGETYSRLQEWIERQGLTPSGVMWEAYLDDPTSVEPAELRTEVCWPVEAA